MYDEYVRSRKEGDSFPIGTNSDTVQGLSKAQSKGKEAKPTAKRTQRDREELVGPAKGKKKK